ncbi:helix-turn-helix domain-containing protein [Pedobacter sp. GR22-6]|uniref:helix-turn-helix domain-containing protein n=1 Tax=Pedobacter sp. GR22-6 TaxID=3127957 RepID=UPI00307DD465
MYMGQVLEGAIRKKGQNISELARLLEVNRRTVYHWFKQEELSQQTVEKLGAVLKHDFSKEFPDLFKENSQARSNSEDLNIEDLKEKEEYWKNKYIALLERYADLLAQEHPCP